MTETTDKEYNYAYKITASAIVDPAGLRKFEYLFAKIGDAVMFQMGMEEKGFYTDMVVVPLKEENE
tara:strand:+ start:2671 stop:2868 length:198 start_codon:yes stop_codon:yes gene_type:complete